MSVYHVGPDGWTKMSGTDVGELHYEYYPADPVANPERHGGPCEGHFVPSKREHEVEEMAERRRILLQRLWRHRCATI